MLQMSHWNNLGFVWLFLCVCRLPQVEKALLQFGKSQWYGFSPENKAIKYFTKFNKLTSITRMSPEMSFK